MMSKTTNILVTLGLIACLNTAFAQTSCSTMYAGLTCRTSSQDPTKMDANALSGARTWLCNSYPAYCSAINSGGAYSSCNSAEQLSYAMNTYYANFKSQGTSACNFGGVAVIVSQATTAAAVTPATTAATPVVAPTPSPASTLATDAQCQSMYSQASCRTASQDPSQVDAAGVQSSRTWLCNVYPQFCLAITSGAYTSCNTVQQLSYAMSLYYNQFQSQGTSACNFGGIGKLNTGTAAVATSAASVTIGVNCTAMYLNLTCRTTSQNPAALDISAVTSARSWLCSSYPSMCNAINSGGAYATCNSAEQLSYSMDLYYKQFSSQGSSACSFNGLAQLVKTASAASAVVVAPTPSPQAGSSKAGLAWPINQFNDGTNPALGPWAQGQISWIYTWSWDYAPLTIASTNLEWVPMLHSQTEASAFIGKIQSGAYDNIKNVLLFNEPDLNYPPYAYGLDVNTAISITLQVFQAMQARGKTWRVGTPAMSYNQGWLQQYLSGVYSQCPTCKFSFVPVHCYTLDSNSFKNTVQSYYNAFGLPIWVTEFADTDFNSRNWQASATDVKNFMSDTTTWLNAQSWVERYSWFGVMRAVDVQDKANMVMNMDGSRTTLGDQYVLRGGSN